MSFAVRLAALLLAASAVTASAEGFACRFAPNTGDEAFEVKLAGAGADWTFTVEDETYPAQPVQLAGSTAAHFLVAPVDKAADAVALVSVFEDGQGFLSLHGDIFGALGETRTGTCTREGG